MKLSRTELAATLLPTIIAKAHTVEPVPDQADLFVNAALDWAELFLELAQGRDDADQAAGMDTWLNNPITG